MPVSQPLQALRIHTLRSPEEALESTQTRTLTWTCQRGQQPCSQGAEAIRGRSTVSYTSRAAPSPSCSISDTADRKAEDASGREGSWAVGGWQELSKADAWERLGRW
jgi:hypothetical protein